MHVAQLMDAEHIFEETPLNEQPRLEGVMVAYLGALH